MPDIHPFAIELTEKVKRKSDQVFTLKLRELLKGFGYADRTEDSIAFVRHQLKAVGLAANLTLDVPRKLDDKVVVIPAATTGPLGPPAATPPPVVTPSLDPIAQAVEATVEIINDPGRGSGFIIHPDGLVITARHVIDDRDRRSLRNVQVRLFPERSGERLLEGVVFRSHHLLDYALLWLVANGPFPVMALGEPKNLRHAQTIFAIGSHAGRPGTVSRGIVSNPNGRFRKLECIQSDAAIDHGNSGGPLITEDGHAVGINLWGIGQFAAAKFSLPIDYLTHDIEQALRRGRSRCLQLAYCPVCGWSDETPPTWYCRNCGAPTTSAESTPLQIWRTVK